MVPIASIHWQGTGRLEIVIAVPSTIFVHLVANVPKQFSLMGGTKGMEGPIMMGMSIQNTVISS